MSAPLTHATVRGVLHIRQGFVPPTVEPWVRMCDMRADHYNTLAAEVLRNTLPTCPACAVLRDAALEGREVEP